MHSLIIFRFDREDDAEGAYRELESAKSSPGCIIRQAALVRRHDGEFRIIGSFDDDGILSDRAAGGLIGMVIGIIGGPVGMLLGGGIGLAAGRIRGERESEESESLVEAVIAEVRDDCAFIAVVADESDPSYLDTLLSGRPQAVSRYDIAEIMAEVDEIEDLEREMARKARAELRDTRKGSRRERVEEHRRRLREGLEG